MNIETAIEFKFSQQSVAAGPRPRDGGSTQLVSDLIGTDSKETICPSCRTEIHTEIRHECSVEAHLLALIFCVFYCFPCSLLPYCMSMCKNTNHYCPNCGALIGVCFG